MKTSIGIDLGTTYSAVAIMQDGQPTILPNVEGRILRRRLFCFLQRMPTKNLLSAKWQSTQRLQRR